MNARRRLCVRRPNDIVLDAICQGPATGTPFVMLHGLADSWRAFEPLLSMMPANRAVAALSQRGHGASSKPEAQDAYRAEDFACDALALLDELGCARAYIVGHSMGAWAACHFAARFPARLAGLALIGAFAHPAQNAGVAELRREVAALSDPVDPGFVRAFQESASAPDLPAEFMESVVGQSMRLPAFVWRHALENFAASGLPNGLEDIRAPVRLIWGDLDQFVPRSDQETLLGRIRTASLSVHAGAGHAPHWERPAKIARELAAFAEECAKASLSGVA